MKELMATACNVTLVPGEGALRARVEVILVLSEREYGFDSTGEVTKTRRTSTVRFAGSPDALRTAGKQMRELADAADEAASAWEPKGE